MIRDFETWNNNIGESSQLAELENTQVGIEAADYLLNRIIKHPHAREPLVAALGGVHHGLQCHVEEDLRTFAHYKITPIFVFSGIDVVRPDDPFRKRGEGAAVNANAWALYDSHQAEQSVQKFGESPYFTPEDLFRAFQEILVQNNIDFLVAPYSAWAQLAYLEKQKRVHAISGSSETLLFECDKIITLWDFEAKTFRWISRAKCFADLEKFGNGLKVTDDIFVDACLLSGSDFLQTIPNLEAPNRSKAIKPYAAIDLINNSGRSGIQVVLNNVDDPKLRAVRYLEKFRTARMAIKHHPIITSSGKVEPLHNEQLPNDAHEFISQRLPDELFHYLSRGLVGSRLISRRAFSEIIEAPPVDGGDSATYRTLVGTKLSPLRTAMMNLLSSSLHNYFSHKDLTLKCWFPDTSGKPQTSTIITGPARETAGIIESWNVREEVFKDAVAKHKPSGYLGSAILSLQDAGFVSKSSVTKNDNKPHLLSTMNELVYNTIWRFLTVREYVDINHNLTAWGKTLATVMKALNGRSDLEEAAFTAVELLRLNMLNSDPTIFPTYNGAPMRGEEEEKNYNLLVSRVAGLGKLQHRPIGFTGPLSQHLLGYNSIINAVRSTDRDLIEASATHMFMNGSVQRDPDNSTKLGFQLPFLVPVNCTLSIAVKSYLDDLVSRPDPTSPEGKTNVKETASAKYFPQSIDFAGDLKTAFELWDAVFAGVSTSGNLVKESEKKIWTDANEWLGPRR